MLLDVTDYVLSSHAAAKRLSSRRRSSASTFRRRSRLPRLAGRLRAFACATRATPFCVPKPRLVAPRLCSRRRQSSRASTRAASAPCRCSLSNLRRSFAKHPCTLLTPPNRLLVLCRSAPCRNALKVARGQSCQWTLTAAGCSASTATSGDTGFAPCMTTSSIRMAALSTVVAAKRTNLSPSR